jgi:uncharacterized protein YkwD
MFKFASLFVAPLLAALAVVPVAVPAGPTGATAIEAEIIRLTNVERQKAGVPPLRQNATIAAIAANYAAMMARLQKMDHHLDGGDAGGRLTHAGYRWSWWGENIAWNQADANAVVQAWMNSPPHRQNLLNPNFTEIGVGVAFSIRGEPYYSQVFGHPAQ